VARAQIVCRLFIAQSEVAYHWEEIDSKRSRVASRFKTFDHAVRSAFSAPVHGLASSDTPSDREGTVL